MNVDGRGAWITGGSSGIGAALAEELPGAVRESPSPPDEKGSWPRWPAWLDIAATFMIEADDAARRIADAIEKGKAETVFPLAVSDRNEARALRAGATVHGRIEVACAPNGPE
jgi:NAD(P)-dependent dehydrogenase (short-subunit alcohol dehydrogenase family)